MSHPQAVSGTPSKPADSPHNSQSRTAQITTAAQQNMTTAASSARPLATPQPTYDWLARESEANLLLLGGKKDEARKLFTEILELAAKVTQIPANSTFIAECKIGMAASYDRNSKERLEWVFQAQSDIERIFDQRDLWNVPETEAIITYRHLQRCLYRIQDLIPSENELTIQDIDRRLEECKQNIPLLSDFNNWLFHAKLCLHQRNHEGAEQCFTNALQVIVGKTESPYRLARADCCLKWAAVYPFDHLKRQETVLLAQDAVFALEGIEEELCEDKSIISGLTRRREFLEKLHDLTPLKSTRMEIGRKILACNEELKRLNPQSRPFYLPLEEGIPTPQRRSSGDAFGMPLPDDLSPRKVSEGSDVSGRFGRLFAVFVFAVLAISAVVFYRRNIMKIN